MKKYCLLALVVILSFSLKAQSKISPEQANKHLGEKVTIIGKVSGSKHLRDQQKQPTILSMGNNAANPSVAVVITHDITKNFSYKPDEYLREKTISVTGTITDLNGTPTITINSTNDIVVQPTGGMEFKPLELDGLNRFFQE